MSVTGQGDWWAQNAPKPTAAPASGAGDWWAQNAPKPATAPQQETPQPPSAEKPGFFSGLYDSAIGGPVEMVKQLYQKHADIVHSAADEYKKGNYANAAAKLVALAPVDPESPVVQQLGEMAKGQVKALNDEWAKGRELVKGGRYSEGAGHILASVLPVIGPAAANIGEDAGAGNLAHAAGSATGLIGTSLLAGGEDEEAAAKAPKVVKPKVVTAAQAAADEFGVKTSRAQGGGQLANVIDQGVRKLPLSSAPYVSMARTQMAQVTAAADSIADGILAEAKGTTPTIRGEAIQQGLTQARQAASEAYGQALTKIKDAGGGTVEIPGANLGKVAGDLLKDIKPVEGYSEGFEGGARAKAQAILQNFEKIGNKPLTFENAVKLRQHIFQETNGAEISPYAGALKKMNHALHDEMVPALANAGFKDLADNFQNASDNYRSTLDALDESVVKRLLNKDPADVGTFLVNNASPTAIATIKQLAPGKIPQVGRAVWNEIWEKTLTGQDGMVAGKKLVDGWRSMSPDTKTALYGAKQVGEMDRFVGLVDKLGLDPAHKMMQRTAFGPMGEAAAVGGLKALGVGFGPLGVAMATPYVLARIMTRADGLEALSNLVSATSPKAASVAAARVAMLVNSIHQEQLMQPPASGSRGN